MSKKNLRILMFAPLCFPPACTAAIVNSKLALAMISKGWGIDVVTNANITSRYLVFSSANYKDWEPLEKHLHSINIPTPHRWSLSNVLLKLRRLISRNDYSIIDKWADQAALYGEKLILRNDYDLIISRGNPYQAHFPALSLSRRYNLPWIANWNDAYPSQKYPPPYGQGPEAKIPDYLSKVFSDIADNASWLTFPSERFRKYMCSYLSKNTDLLAKSTGIPPIAMRRFRNKPANKHAGFVMCHVGRLGPHRESPVFLEGIKIFLNRAKESVPIIFKLIGQQSDEYIDKIHAFGLGSYFSIEKSKPYIKSLEYMQDADVLLILESDSQEGVFFPSKFIDYVQAGRPVLSISPLVSNMHDVLSKHGGGIAVDVQSSESIAAGIETLYNAWKTGKLDEAYGSACLFDLFSEETVLAQYLEIFQKIRIR